MKGYLQHPWRVLGRLFCFAGQVLLFFLDYFINVALRPGLPLTRARALWLQVSSRRTLRLLKVKVKTTGAVPLRGLIVSNHLSYLDILVLSAITPAVFVSKSEVKQWPVFGWFARLSGTLFVHRNRRSDVARLNEQIAHVLDAGVPVVLFPEGTSSDGRHILPFKSSLLEPVLRQDQPLCAALIRYSLPDGLASEDVCYWGDMTFLPHLLNLLSKRRVHVFVSFTPVERRRGGRKDLARYLHSEIVRMKEGVAGEVHA
jgi:1-acyl-sn-glycerol-3-phosphate acyltransferase